MNKKFNIKTLCFFTLFILLSASVLATKQSPPEMNKKYENEATLIVRGEIGSPVKCSLVKSKRYCDKSPSFTAPLKVESIVKGEKLKEKTIPITFCSSGPTSAPVSGEKGTYYFKKSSKGEWQMIYSDEVIYAAGALPNCR